MERIDFNENWTYRHLSGEADDKKGYSGQPGPSGRPVILPHDAMLAENRSEKSASGINGCWFEGHDYLYEKEFHVPADYKDKDAVFEFEGVYHNAEVLINGQKAAFRPYGYTNFYVDANPYLKYGETNWIEVIARNADQPNSRWYSGAGIYRPVSLYLAEKRHILMNGLKVRTKSIRPAVVEVLVDTTDAGRLTIEILREGRVVTGGTADTEGKIGVSVEIPDALLWDCGHPNLYTCRVTYEADTAEVAFGIRTLEWNAEKGLTVNGKRVILRGACIHHDNGILGACAFPEAEERKVRIMKENGYNALRSAHNPCSKALLNACDRLGMLVLDEYVDVWYIHKTEYDYVNYLAKWWKQDLKDMVEKDYNHPSVIMYSTGNEVSETAQKKGIKLTSMMTEYLHSLDDTRPVTCGINIFFNFLSSVGFGVYSDKKAKKEAENSGKKKKAVGSEFFNNLAGILGGTTMKLGAAFYECDRKTRDAFAAMDIAGYNYGIFRYRHDLRKYPERLILGSETFCSDAYDFWEAAKKNPRIIGDFVWAGMDYMGEVGIGAWEYEDYAPKDNGCVGWMTAGSGRVDLIGNPLAEAAYTKAAFELEQKPVIGVRPVNHTKDRHTPSAWKMSNARQSWSWNGCDGNAAIVEVYARAARVDLFINGKKVGSRRVKAGRLVQFETKYYSGKITAVAYDENGDELSRNSLETAENETYLNAIPEQKACAPKEICFVKLSYSDRNGTVKPLERGRIRVTVSKGTLLGLGSACPFNRDGYLNRETDTYYGEALAAIRADGEGRVEAVVSDGVRECRVLVPEPPVLNASGGTAASRVHT